MEWPSGACGGRWSAGLCRLRHWDDWEWRCCGMRRCCFMFNVEKFLTTDYNVFLNTLLCHCSLVTAAIFVLQSVKKSFALSGVSEVLKCSPGALRNLLRQDHRVSLRFTASLLSKCLFSKECVMVTILDTKNKTYLCNYKYIFQYTELITIFPYWSFGYSVC